MCRILPETLRAKLNHTATMKWPNKREVKEWKSTPNYRNIDREKKDKEKEKSWNK